MREYNPALIATALVSYLSCVTIINATGETPIIQDATGLILACVPILVVTALSAWWYGKSS